MIIGCNEPAERSVLERETMTDINLCLKHYKAITGGN